MKKNIKEKDDGYTLLYDGDRLQYFKTKDYLNRFIKQIIKNERDEKIINQYLEQELIIFKGNVKRIKFVAKIIKDVEIVSLRKE